MGTPAASCVTRRQSNNGAPGAHASNRAGRRARDLGGDRLVHGAELDAAQRQEVVERRALDIGARHVGADIGAHPHGDQRERLVVGEVDALDAQHVGAAVDVQRVGDGRGRVDEAEREDLAARPRAGGLDRGLDGGDPPERLAHRVDGREPARAPPARDQALLAQQVERPAHGDPAGAVLPGQLELAGQGSPGADVAGRDPGPQRIGEVEVPHEMYCTCLRPT